MKPKVYSVSQVNSYVRHRLEEDVVLQDVFIEGELSNFTAHTSGHLYFTLKDDQASLRAVMFRGDAHYLPFMPENGMKVIVCGRMTLYEKSGQAQLVVAFMEPAGVGALALAFQQLKDKLEKEGLFDPIHKKEIPPYPRCVAIVTSPVGAAVQDIINIAKRRNKGVRLVVAPAQVQGEEAPQSIAKAIGLVNRWGKADVLIVGRGGGSMEDLWAFNEEVVARAIFASKIPVISAVGHETDYTIADFVADLRAPTPSAAAELAVFQQVSAERRLAVLFEALQHMIGLKLEEGRQYAQLEKAMERRMASVQRNSRQRFLAASGALHHLSPLNILNRGFALVYDQEQKQLVSSASGLAEGQCIRTVMQDGAVTSQVLSILLEDEENGSKKTNI